MPKRKQVEIPVVFTPDSSFIVQTCVAIVSMLKSKKKDTHYYFYIIVSTKIDRNSLKRFERISQQYDEFVYEIIFINTEMFDQLKIISSNHITTSTYYRLGLADILTEDRCMYHDGDILVLDDLSDMFNVSMEDCYVAGIKTIAQQQGNESDLKLISEWKFPSMDQYIMAGDLTFNLKLIREKNVQLLFYEEMSKGYPQQDQDVLNYCCYDHIAFLPLRYCLLNRWISNNEINNFRNQIHSRTEIAEARKNPAIIHFAGTIAKPWINLKVSMADKWWQVAKEILTKEEYEQWYNRALIQTQKSNFKLFADTIKKRNLSIFLFGYSKITQDLIEDISLFGINISGIFDNNPNKVGQIYKGIPVIKFDIACLENGIVVITSQKYANDIREQLLKSGVEIKNIYIFGAKTQLYYQLLDKKYRDQEYRELFSIKYKNCDPELNIDELKKMDTEEYWRRIYI